WRDPCYLLLTYPALPRRLKFSRAVSWPASGEIDFHFAPLPPFGMSRHGGRTCVRATETQMHLNMNSGAFSVESALSRIDVLVSVSGRTFAWKGNVLS